jgi:hypothetical protein
MHNDPYFTAVSRRTCCYDVQRRSLLGTKVRVHSDLVWCHESSVDSHLGHHFPPGKVTVGFKLHQYFSGQAMANVYQHHEQDRHFPQNKLGILEVETGAKEILTSLRPERPSVPN